MLLDRKSEELINPGYIFAPYIPADNSVEYSGKKTMRKYKINRIFELQLDIKCESPIPTKKVLNNKYYQTIEIKKPT